MRAPPRFAFCNELFKDLPFPQACREIRRAGFTGIELAPFTLAEDATLLSATARREIQAVMADAGLSFVGLHWLLVSPAGLHATTPEEPLRRRTWNFLRALIELCAGLAGPEAQNTVMIFGSPKQRSTVSGQSPADATRRFFDELSAIAPHARAHSVKLLIEPLSPDQTDVVTTLEEAVSMVRQIDNPALRTMFDVHNAKEERLPHPQLLAEFMPYIEHIHVNEFDGREPGMGGYDFHVLLHALHQLDYGGWVSVEAFDFSRDPVSVAARAFETLSAASSDLAIQSQL